MIRLHWLSTWSVLLVSFTLYVPRSAAQTLDRVCDPTDAQSCVQVVTEGQKTPFTGILMTNKRAAKLAVAADGCQARIDLTVGEVKDQCQIQVQGYKSIRENDQSTTKFQLDLLTGQLKKAEELYSPRWYERPAFVAAVTAVCTVGVLVVAVRAVEISKK